MKRTPTFARHDPVPISSLSRSIRPRANSEQHNRCAISKPSHAATVKANL